MFLYHWKSTADTLLQEIHILTDVWIYDVDFGEKLEVKITEIFSYIRKYKIEIPEESCLVLEFRNTKRWGYYFVNHAEQRLFWLDEYNGMDFLFEVKVEYTVSLVGEFLFCRNNEYFIYIEGWDRPRNESLVLVSPTLRSICATWFSFVNFTRRYRQAS